MIASLNEVLADPVLKGKDPVVVDIQNVSDYCVETKAKASDLTDIPCLIPPWNDTLLVYNLRGIDLAIFAELQKHKTGQDIVGHYWVPQTKSFVKGSRTVLELDGQINKKEWAISHKNTMTDFKALILKLLPDISQVEIESFVRDGLEAEMETLGTALMAFGFAHCKNVSTAPVALPRSLRRRIARKECNPKTKVYTLNIKPMQKVLATQGQVGSVGIKQALHICRGHFKTYAEGKGLFGKLHGTYWWPQMVRGDQQHGVINKKYNVEAA
jgi:hypothetical protein